MILDKLEKLQAEAVKICGSTANAKYTLPEDILEQIPQQFRELYSKMDPFTCCITLNMLNFYFRSMYEMLSSDVDIELSREKLNSLMEEDLKLIFKQKD